MIRRYKFHALTVLLLVPAASCIGSTGGDLVEIDAYAAGPTTLVKGQPYRFTNDRGFDVTLDAAKIHIGALYLNQSVPTSVASDTSCFLAGIYVAELTSGRDVDVLDPTLQPFPTTGFATTERARTAEVWLSGGDVETRSDPTIIVSVRGTAVSGTESYPFEAAITISDNRVVTPPDPALPGAKPICKQRIVSPISVDITPSERGSLVVRVDPAGWFGNVDFSELEQVGDNPSRYRFRDDGTDQPSRALYAGIRANAGVYALSWEDSSGG